MPDTAEEVSPATLRPPSKRKAIVLLVIGLVALVALIAVFRSIENPQDDARATATRFVDLVTDGNIAAAFDLTMKTEATGADVDALRDDAKQQGVGCGLRFSHTFPKQSLGNRFRRALRGEEIDQEFINVEFDGCRLVKVTMRQDAEGVWKVANFASHAG